MSNIRNKKLCNKFNACFYTESEIKGVVITCLLNDLCIAKKVNLFFCKSLIKINRMFFFV